MDSTEYPSWVLKIATLQDVYDEVQLMEIAIALSLANSRETGGGPFGAVVATGEGRLVAMGYNQVMARNDSTAHAEIVALRRAEQIYGTFRLRGEKSVPSLALFTSCAPCLMCTGAIHWSGIPRVLAAARAEDAEALGFIEGTRNLDVPSFLSERGIEYRGDFLREKALDVFREYRGPVYNG